MTFEQKQGTIIAMLLDEIAKLKASNSGHGGDKGAWEKVYLEELSEFNKKITRLEKS